MNKVEMIFWDVQHGHATYIKTPNGRHIVIDLGTGSYSNSNRTFSPLSHLQRNYNIYQLDCVIITHPHLDHIDDIMQFDRLNPKIIHRPDWLSNREVMDGVQLKDREKFQKYCEINDRYNASVPDHDNTNNSNNWGGLQITIYTSQNCDHGNPNNHSLLSVLEYEGIKVIIPGDNEKESLEELMKNPVFQYNVANADILLAPHHGRESGYHTDFVKKVNPKLTIVSDGKIVDSSANNRYSQMSSGLDVQRRNGGLAKRYCLSTNSDGHIVVKFGKEYYGSSLYVEGA